MKISGIAMQFASSAVMAFFCICSEAAAQEPPGSYSFADQINQANAMVLEGEFDDAIAKYQQVQATADDRFVLDYNMAVAHYRKGELDVAERLFKQTATAPNATIAADSRFNLGNCYYANSLKLAEKETRDAIATLRQAIANYRNSLRLNPDNPDARANIELAVRMIRNLEEQQDQQQQDQQQQDQQQEQQQQEQQQQEQQQQEQQQQEQQQQEQQQQEQQQQEQQQQEQQQQESGGSEGDSQSEEAGGKEGKGESQEQSDGEKNQSEPTQEDAAQPQPANQEQSDSNPQTANSEAEPQDGEDADESSLAEEKKTDGDEPIPSGDLSAADQQNADEKPVGASPQSELNATNGMMTKEEALKMLQAVRDRDMLRRLRQEQIERSRHVRVEKDW